MYRLPKNQRLWYTPIPSIPRAGKSNLPPRRFPRRFAPRNDMGVVTTYHSTGRHPSDPPWGAGHLPSRGGFGACRYVVPFNHGIAPQAFPTVTTPVCVASRNDVADGGRDVEGTVPYAFRDGGPVPYAKFIILNSIWLTEFPRRSFFRGFCIPRPAGRLRWRRCRRSFPGCPD